MHRGVGAHTESLAELAEHLDSGRIQTEHMQFKGARELFWVGAGGIRSTRHHRGQHGLQIEGGDQPVGDFDGDQKIDIVANTREGFLWAWKTQGHVGGAPNAKVPAIQWEGFHRDDQNTGNATGKFGQLKSYPRLQAPIDNVCDGGCCCDETSTNSTSVAALFALVTLPMLRRRRRSA